MSPEEQHWRAPNPADYASVGPPDRPSGPKSSRKGMILLLVAFVTTGVLLVDARLRISSLMSGVEGLLEERFEQGQEAALDEVRAGLKVQIGLDGKAAEEFTALKGGEAVEVSATAHYGDKLFVTDMVRLQLEETSPKSLFGTEWVSTARGELRRRVSFGERLRSPDVDARLVGLRGDGVSSLDLSDYAVRVSRIDSEGFLFVIEGDMRPFADLRRDSSAGFQVVWAACGLR